MTCQGRSIVTKKCYNAATQLNTTIFTWQSIACFYLFVFFFNLCLHGSNYFTGSIFLWGYKFAFGGLFAAVDFQLCPQMTCLRGCIVTMVTLVLIFLRCVFLNGSSKGLPWKMHSHNGCIFFFNFLLCALSNVSSNCLLWRMQSHTGCI